MSITTEYPIWLSFFCLLLAAAGSWFLYRNNKLDLPKKWMLWVLMVFRFISIFIIAFLLLGPLMKMINRKVEKPFIILAFDNSESVTAAKDSSNYKKQLPAIIEKLNDKLSKEYQVKTYIFGKSVKHGSDLNFREKQTDISSVFNEIKEAYSNQNLGAIVLASDGIYNEGSNPIYTAREIKAPVFTIALGDTTQHKDLFIKSVKHNQLVYLGNMFPLQIDISAFGCNNENTVLTVQRLGQTVFTKQLSINSSNYFATIPVELQASETGMQHYIITVSKISGEVTYTNNRADIFINVISGKQKILLLASAPHPDITAYKQAIESNENDELVVKNVNDFNVQNVKDYNLAIIYQLPGLRGEGIAAIKQLREKKVPLLFVLGSQTNIGLLNSVENSLIISANQANTNDVLPIVNPSFNIFSLNEDELATIKKFPPLQAPYGNYRITAEANVLFRQQIGYVKTEIPLVFFSKEGDLKNGFICGEGFWKWRLYDAELSKQQATQNIINKIVQYLSSKDDKSLFRISHSKKKFYENENIEFDAQVYNLGYELVNSADVIMKIKNAAGREFNYTFSKTEKAYTLNAGIMAVGNYTYQASVTNAGKTDIIKGSFTVLPLQAEFTQTVADHQLLNQLSTQSEGKLFYPEQTDELIKALKDNPTIKPVIYKQEEVKSWINLKWIFFLFLGLMTVEWFIRKWNGSV